MNLNFSLKKSLYYWNDGLNMLQIVMNRKEEITICCNSVLKIIQRMESKTDLQIQNDKSYYADRLRNSNDIRNKDPNTLTIYQREQLKRYQQAKEAIS